MGRLSNKVRFDVLRRDAFRCTYCGMTAAEGAKLEVDHVEARSKGGADTVDNLVTACFTCNRGKRADAVLSTIDEPAGDPLVGKFIHILGDDGFVSRQGQVEAHIRDGYYLVAEFDWLIGSYYCTEVVHISELQRARVYSSDEDMRHAYDYAIAPVRPRSDAS